MKNTDLRNKKAKRLRAMRKELRALRNATVVAHGMCTARYVQSDSEMKQRAGKVLAKGINESERCLKDLGYHPKKMPIS